MHVIRLLATIAAVIGGSLSLSGAPAAAAPVPTALVGTAVVGEGLAAYAHYRPYRHRHYAPRRAYRPHRSYRPRYVRPRVVCRTRYTAWGPRRVCYRR